MSSYDQNLLDEAPRATRAQLQEGYNVDLLEQPPRRTPSVRNPPLQIPQPAPVNVPLTPAIAETGSGEKFGSPTHNPAGPRSRTSFWRSRNGVIAVVVIILIVIGAVVGGAVGGTVKKSSNNNAVGTNTTSSLGPSITSVSNSTSGTTIANQAPGTSSANQGVGGGTTRPTVFTVPLSTSTTGQSVQNRFAKPGQ